MNNIRNKLIFCPDWSRDNPYQKLLYKSISGLGIPCAGITGLDFTFKWLFTHQESVRFLHFHWLFGIYDPNSDGLDLKKAASFILKVLVAKLLGYKILWTVHNFISHEPTNVKLEIYLRKLLAAVADRVIVHCEHAKSLILNKWINEAQKIDVIPHGSYIGYYPNTTSRSGARLQIGLQESEYVFLFFGAIRNYKGLKQLLNSFDEVSMSFPNARLVIAGKPFGDAIKQELVELCRGKNISLHLRYIPEEEVQLYFNAADAIVLPYQNILTSGAVLLALSFGLPPIVPGKGCIPELINAMNGYPYEHERELTHTMFKAIKEGYKPEMRQEAYKVALSVDWDVLTKELYLPLLQKWNKV